MENKLKDIDNIKINGFVDNAGAQIYPYQPEKHEELSVSKIFPHFIDIYSLGVCPSGEVLVTIDRAGEKIAVRLPMSDEITTRGKIIENTMVQKQELKKFPCKLKIEYNVFMDDYMVMLLLPEN